MKKTTILKRLCVMSCCVVLLASATGCNKSVGTGMDEKVSISVGNWPNAEANPKGYVEYQEKIKRFNEEYPNIEIIPDEWVYDVKTFLAKAEGGTLPTVYYTPFTEAIDIINLGYSADITKETHKFDYYDKINDVLFDNISRNGKIYLLPKSVYTLGMVLNLDLFRQAGLMEADETPKAPKTFNELISVARTITEKTGKPGFVFPTTSNAGGWNFTALAWNFGVKFMEKTDGKWKATFNSPKCIEALQYLKDLKWKYNVLPQNTLVNNAEVSKAIGTGQAAMAFAAPNSIVPGLLVSYGMSKDSIGLCSMPAGENNHISLMGGSYVVLASNATEEQKDAAFKWLEFEGITPNLTDASKESLRKSSTLAVENGKLIGTTDFSPWNDKSTIDNYRKELAVEFCNINLNHVKLYNERESLEFQVEEPVCAQDLYALLDGCIQSVLKDKNADCSVLLEKAASDFQDNFLNYLN